MVKQLVMLAGVGIAALMGADGAKLYGAKCAECHGANGKESAIAGKAIAGDGAVLAKLTGYKNGTFGGEQKTTMQASLEGLGAADLQAIAGYVGALK